jgi:type IV secretory pathway TrbL component
LVLLGGEVAFLSSTLIVIDITLAGLFWAWGADEDVLHRLVKKTLYIGFFAFIIGNFNRLSGIVFESFSGLGLKAGGSALSGFRTAAAGPCCTGRHRRRQSDPSSSQPTDGLSRSSRTSSRSRC